MGFLNFLSKKSESDLRGARSLRTSAYDATKALSPPIRGTYPVLGNGKEILEQYRKTHDGLVSASPNQSPGPAPPIPPPRAGLRSRGVDRPRTAPSSRPGITDSSNFQLQPISGPVSSIKKKFGPYRLPPKLAIDVQISPNVAKPAPSPGLISIYSDSVRSAEPTGKPKGYVDLLEAQSRINPLDFYTRVQATGARNYGEDVADRNREGEVIGPSTTRAREPLPNQLEARWSSVISKDVDDDSEDDIPNRSAARQSVSSGPRSKRNSTHAAGFSKRTTSRLPQTGVDDVQKPMSRTESARSERAAQRKSMPSASAYASSETTRSLSTERRGKGEDSNLFPDALRDRVRAATAHEREQTKPNISTKRQSLVSPNSGEHSRQMRNDTEKPLPALPQPSREPSKRRPQSHHSAVLDSRLLSKRQSLQGIRSGGRGEVYEDTYQQKKSLQGTQPTRGRSSARRQLGSTTDLQDSFYDSPAQHSDHISQIMHLVGKTQGSNGESPLSDHIRGQSIFSSPSTGAAFHDIENFIPERESSLRRGSVTSETAMSTLSSNPFRPQSGHTTSTSIEFSPVYPYALSGQFIPPVPHIPFSKTPQPTSGKQSAVSSSHSHMTPRRRQSSELYLEGNVSPGGSSTTSPSRGSYEQDLIFSETSYGISGVQMSGLPGLFDVDLPSASADFPSYQGLDNPIVSELLHIPIRGEISSDESFDNQDWLESSDDEMNFDIPMGRTGSALRYD